MSKITTDTWIQQFTLFLNGNYVRWQELALNLVKGSTNVLVFDHQDSYLSDDPESSVRLQFAPGQEVQGINCDPPFGQLTPLVREEKVITYTFRLDESAVARNFALQFEMPGYAGMPKSQLLRGQVIDVPWQSDFTVLVDGEEKDWSDAYLAIVNRKVCKLTLDYTGSPLIGLKDAAVALESESGGGVPDLVANPKFGDLTPMVYGESSMSWDIQSTPDAGNASFKVRLVMPKLLGMLPSPLLSGNILNDVWGEFSVRVNDVEVNFVDLWFYIVNEETVTLKLDFGGSALPGLPGVALSLDSKPGALTDGLIVKPELGQAVYIAGQSDITWEFSLRPGAVNGPFDLHWNMHGVSGVPASPTVSGNIFNEVWKEFHFSVDAMPVGSEEPWIPVIDERPSMLSVNCEKSSVRGLKDASLALEWKSGAGGEGMILMPEVGNSVPVEAATRFLFWTFAITPEAKSAPFEMWLRMPGFDRMPQFSLAGHTYNKVWERDFKICVDNVGVEWGDLTLPMRVGKDCTLELEVKGAWLTDTDTSVSLEYESEKGEILSASPPFGEPLKIVEGADPFTWIITVNPLKHGTFKLFFKIHQRKGVPVSPKIPGSVIDFSKEIEVLFDRYPFTFSSDKNAYPCRGAEHEITIIPEPSSALLGKMAMFIWSGTPAETLGISMDLGPKLLTQQGAKFELNCTKALADGLFALRLCVPEFEQMSQPLSFSLGHNLVTATRWTDPWPTPPGFADFIRATSVFLNTGAPGVQVQVTFRGETYFRKIQSSGTYGETYSELPGYTFLIKNLYDGSEV